MCVCERVSVVLDWMVVVREESVSDSERASEWMIPTSIREVLEVPEGHRQGQEKSISVGR